MPLRMGPWEIVLLLAVILIVFGVGRLPQVGGALGKSLGAFRQAQKDKDSEEQA